MNKDQLKDLINEVIKDMTKENLKNKLKQLVKESIEEIKYEAKDCIAGEMEEINKIVKEYSKDCELAKGDDGNYALEGKFPHRLHIRPQSEGIYDVLYFKDNTDRTKKLNLNLEELKTFIKDALKSKDLNYVQKAYNKNAENSKDKVEKVENGIRHNILTKKEVKDVKNDNKDYNEQAVKDEKDLPVNNPYREVGKFKRQNENPVKGTKPDYTQPKLSKKDSKLTVKPNTFKGKTRKKD